MTNYPVRLTHRGQLSAESLAAKAREAFGTSAVEGEAVTASFGALTRLTARAAGRELSVETSMDPKVPIEVAAETVRRYNRFLEDATGYTAKERAKRLRKSAPASDRGA